MNSRLEQQLTTFGAEGLTPLVRKALADERAQSVAWSFSPLAAGTLSPVTAGIYRFSGNATCGGGVVPRSLVLKIIQWIDRGEAGKGFINDPAGWNFWKRERLVHQSRILDGWRGRMVPFKGHAVAEPTPASVWIWLEEVREPDRLCRVIGCHVLAARHIGEFNGAHAGDLPSASHDPWHCWRFPRKWTRVLLGRGLPQLARAAAFFGFTLICGWDCPWARNAVCRGLSTLAALSAICSRAWTLIHQDAHWSNLFATHADDGQDRTAVLDSAFLGIAAIGEGLGTQIAAAGPRWTDYGIIWLGGCIEATANGKTSGIDDLARKYGLSVEEALRRRGLAIRFLFDLADEARLWFSGH